MTPDDVIHTRRTDSARLEGAFATLRALGVYATTGSGICCRSCAMYDAEGHLGEGIWGIVTSHDQVLEGVFAEQDYLGLIDGQWVSSSAVTEAEFDKSTEVRVIRDTAFNPEGTLFLYWDCPEDITTEFLAIVGKVISDADFKVELPEDGSKAIVVTL